MLPSVASASDIVEVLPLTDRIVMVHFDDGKVTLAKPGQSGAAGDVVTVDALDRTLASSAQSYKVSSPGDAAYASAQSPTSVARKSKGTEFSNHCDTWAGKCVNTSPDRALEHWTYLTLPTPMQPGQSYTVDTGGLAKNASTTTFTFDAAKVRSEAIHVNIVAYSTKAPAKFGYIYHWLGDGGGLDVAPLVGRSCHLVRTSDGASVFDAKVAFRKPKTNIEGAYPADTPGQNFLGADVAECDFSSFTTPGEYVLAVDGVGSSFPFKIDGDALRRPFYAAMKGLFIHRSGIEIKPEWAEGYARPAPHNPTLTPGFAGKLKYTTTRYFDVTSGDASDADKAAWEAGIKGDIDTWGWYQDAGDWDAYFSHASIPGLLLTLFEAHPDHFGDGELKIPESGNGLPDVLDEARWLVRFYHRTRHAILDKGYGTGGVGGARVMGDLWGGDLPDGVVAGSWDDTKRQWIVSGEDPWMTYRYAALSAQLALILKTIGKADPEGIDWQAEAKSAHDWAAANTKPTDDTAQGVPLRQVRMHADLALYRLTGDTKYHDAFKADFAVATEAFDDNSKWWELLYPRLPDADPAIKAKILGALEGHAKLELASSDTDRATRWGGNFYMPMFLGQATTPLISDSMLALDVLDNLPADVRGAMRGRAYTTADYFLGTNPLNMTWISGLGPRSVRGVFYLDGFAKSETYPQMGLIPYGPLGTARDWMGNPAPGPWGANWANTDLYPNDIETWPGHERWFDERTGIASCEFTIHQNNVVAAVAYGSLLEPYTGTSNGAGGSSSGGAGGSPGAGGGTSSVGGTGNGSGAQGGASAAGGATSTGGPGAGGATGGAAAPGESDDSGCGCRVVAQGNASGVGALAGLAMALGAVVRRRRPALRSSRP